MRRTSTRKLQVLNWARYAELGQSLVTSRYFTVGDATHTNVAGAKANAAAVAEGLRGIDGLGRFLRPVS